MAPAIAATHTARQPDVGSLGPLRARSLLLARDDADNVDPSRGIIPPHQINNNAVFAVFALLGVAFVVGGIWFFFWAKNGGFHFRKDDWDDYKSTVLRRRGPNGTLLSGATPSTALGGGSVYKDVDDNSTEDATTVVSGTTNMTGITGGVSDIYGREKRRKKREQKEREKERRREEKEREKEERKHGKSSRKVGADGILIDEEAESEAKKHLRSYRHEKPARVGGINKQSEASTWDGSTNPSQSTASGSGVGSTDTGSTVTSELISHRERTPTSTPTKKDAERSSGAASGIRKVYSTADKNASRENERLRSEARRLRREEKEQRAAAAAAAVTQRRDFSWQRADDVSLRPIDEATESMVSGTSRTSAPRATRVPGSWTESDVGTGSEVGTKVYQHPVHIPVPSSSSTATSDFAYQEEKRKKRAGAGYRRTRGGDSESGV
ncbi:hypothetical protein B0T26DRAFT_738133 [Lasiosphaeria miniovina]|uniref:Endosomal spry domain-containing protein n=1 Tax=Lasiosphaeria miniovina TaxID=1954250 RepID=A0AA40B479_9PEZI|nr:uncharacterized protein B0T26DRAFT_738133 [Lasiosphaeria miniovina]KAK0727409.1 hypothetical protein B0T26DRAFT_738133 [Lasiosphaeria miniovina]